MKRVRMTIAFLLLCSAFIRIRQYECSTPDCHHMCFLDGDLCKDCHIWLAACEPLTVW